MPFALIFALAASVAIHSLVLFGTDYALPEGDEPQALLAELRPAPLPPAAVADARPPRKPAKPAKPRPAKEATDPAGSMTAVRSVSIASDSTVSPSDEELQADGVAMAPSGPSASTPPESGSDAAAAPPALAETEAPPRLPPRGHIRYRVDRGDANFEIGYAEHRWEIADGRYRLSSVAETTGLVWLFKAIRVEMESHGLINAAGLQPQVFTVRRDGRLSRERADFDWQAMTVRVAGRGEQPLDAGAQDFLSFNYQLGYLRQLDAIKRMPIATGKKYRVYALEVIGDEEIEVPAGRMRTLHLLAPGENSTELWLAYDYLLLPVKIRFQDAGGASYVQLATRIEVGAAGDAGTPPATDGAVP